MTASSARLVSGVISLAGPWAAGLAVLLALFAAPLPVDAKIFEPDTFTLDNGLQVVVVTNRRAPIVSHMIWYKVGAADEPPGKSGIAHFLEHLMFKGTKRLATGEFSEIVARNGGRENAFTSWDYTGYYQNIAKDRLELMMQNEADRMVNLVLSDEVVLPERDVILEERRSRVENNPASKLQEMARATLFLHHPYGTPIIGWEHEIRQLTTEDALAFYRDWYAPNNAVLVVAGDVSAEEVRAMAERTYGQIEPRPVPERKRTQEARQWAPRRVLLESPEVRQSSINIAYLAPSLNGGEIEHAYALQVLSEIMGGGSASRLYDNLVVEKGLAASAGSYYDEDDLDLSVFGFYASPRPGIEAEAVEAALRAEIKRLLEDGITEAELATAKQRMVSAAVYARDSLGAAPRIFGSALATGQSVEEVEAWPERIEAVTVEQVAAAARAVLKDETSVTSLLLAEPTS